VGASCHNNQAGNGAGSEESKANKMHMVSHLSRLPLDNPGPVRIIKGYNSSFKEIKINQN
jgi:hypothetical protein